MLVFPGGSSYEPTDTDRLWLLRAVQAEGPPRIGVARALINLFSLRASKGLSSSLTSLVRAYAQPVNPAWYPDGKRLHAAFPDGVPAAELAKAETRKSVHSARTSFTPETIDAVKLALSSPYAGDVTDYAAPTIDASAKYVARSPVIQGENRFWTRLPGWTGYGVAQVGTGFGAALLLAGAGALVWWLRTKGGA